MFRGDPPSVVRGASAFERPLWSWQLSRSRQSFLGDLTMLGFGSSADPSHNGDRGNGRTQKHLDAWQAA